MARIKMTDSQREALLDAWQWCDDNDKSTEFMLQYMSDMSGLDYDDVVDYLASSQSNNDRKTYYQQKKK